jgi:hypothetical protein
MNRRSISRPNSPTTNQRKISGHSAYARTSPLQTPTSSHPATPCYNRKDDVSRAYTSTQQLPDSQYHKPTSRSQLLPQWRIVLTPPLHHYLCNAPYMAPFWPLSRGYLISCHRDAAIDNKGRFLKAVPINITSHPLPIFLPIPSISYCKTPRTQDEQHHGGQKRPHALPALQPPAQDLRPPRDYGVQTRTAEA